MRQSRIILSGLLFTIVLQGLSGFSAAPSKAPDVHEVLTILQANRPSGMTEADLNAAAVDGLFSALRPRARLVSDAGQSTAAGSLISKSEVFGGSMAYVRIERVSAGLPETLAETLRAIGRTNKTQGVVLDLRYASGEDYSAAAAVANLFLTKPRPLLNWGEGMKSATAKNDAISVPVAVLLNEQTMGAAEATAAVLRESGAGLLLGNRTAGAAAIPQDHKLSNGQVLRIASQPLELGNGAKLAGSVRPDIEIQVSEEEERTYFADAFAVVQKTNQLAAGDSSGTNGTNRVSRRTRFSEADLVREHSLRSRGEGITIGERRPELPVVNDPVLARALDVLKGLAVVRSARP